MNDWLSFSIGAVCLIAVIGLTYTLGRASIVRDCKAVGVFYLNDEVFDCKLKDEK